MPRYTRRWIGPICGNSRTAPPAGESHPPPPEPDTCAKYPKSASLRRHGPEYRCLRQGKLDAGPAAHAALVVMNEPLIQSPGALIRKCTWCS